MPEENFSCSVYSDKSGTTQNRFSVLASLLNHPKSGFRKWYILKIKPFSTCLNKDSSIMAALLKPEKAKVSVCRSFTTLVPCLLPKVRKRCET